MPDADRSQQRTSQLEKNCLGATGLKIPRIVYGTSCLGNLYESLSDDVKLAISQAWFEHSDLAVIDTAGKYGAGLALEVIGRNLRQLDIPSEKVVISNKLGWKRVPLRTPEPTFEPGAWADLEFDAEQCISRTGILECWEQGCELLGCDYRPQLLSVHDPDEYLAAATSPADRQRRFDDILAAYEALHELKKQGETQAIGVGSKDWRLIEELYAEVELDWVMFANSLTLYRHPPELIDLISRLHENGIGVINSAVFHAGFLVGGAFFDYRIPSYDVEADRALFPWREKFTALCLRYDVDPASACIQFGISPPGVVAIALNTSDPCRVAKNYEALATTIEPAFWQEAKQIGLIATDYPHV